MIIHDTLIDLAPFGYNPRYCVHCSECGDLGMWVNLTAAQLYASTGHQIRHRVHITCEGGNYRARCHETECFWGHAYETIERAAQNAEKHCRNNNRMVRHDSSAQIGLAS